MKPTYAKLSRSANPPPNDPYVLVEPQGQPSTARMTWPLDGALSVFMGADYVRWVWITPDANAKNGWRYSDVS
jgi:hypothetical protein